jgi:hypothetical protein
MKEGVMINLAKLMAEIGRLVVVNDDRLLCEHCYQEQLDERSERTWSAGSANYGECEACGVIVIPPK